MVKSISETLPQRFFDMVLMFTDKLQIGDTPRQSIGCTDWTVLGVSWRPGSRKHMGRKTQNPPQKNVQSQHLELITSLLVALTIVPETVLLLETKIGGKSLGTSIQTEMLSRQAACCGFNEHTIKSSEWHEYPRATRDCDPAYSVGSESPGL